MDKHEALKRFKQRQKKQKEWVEKQVQQRITGRQCGDCQACCEALGVQELNKPANTPCEHQCQAGCAIYANRPRTCQIYTCLWLSGNLEDEDLRPDKLGIVFDMPLGTVIEDLVVAREVWSGALTSEMGALVVHRIAEKFPVYLIYRDGRRGVITTDPEVKKKADQLAATAVQKFKHRGLDSKS